jgi:hypothetical protein
MLFIAVSFKMSPTGNARSILNSSSSDCTSYLNIFGLLTDSAAKSADIIRKSDRLPFVSGRELIMSQRDRVDAARDVIQRAMNLSTLGPTFLNGDGGQNKLKVVFHSVLHFTK